MNRTMSIRNKLADISYHNILENTMNSLEIIYNYTVQQSMEGL